MKFEILPAFWDLDWWGNWDGTYKYPDSNMGGNWLSTNPKVEQDEIKTKNNNSNGLLFDTCKHFRRIQEAHYSSYHLSGIVIDGFVYAAMGDWRWLRGGEIFSSKTGDYENKLLNYFIQNKFLLEYRLTAPGSNECVDTSDSLEKVLRYIAE